MRHPELIIIEGPGRGEVFPLPEGRRLLLGRSPDSDIRLEDKRVSRHHARIEIRDGASGIDDLSMRQRGEDVVIRFGDGPYWKTRIIVEDSTLEEMRQEDVFLF